MTFRLQSAIPKLASLDLARTLEYYDRIGFAAEKVGEDYGIARRDDIEIHFWLCDDPEIPKMTACRVNVQNLDALADELERLQVLSTHGRPRLQPWGLRECHLIDVDGNLITFAERVS